MAEDAAQDFDDWDCIITCPLPSKLQSAAFGSSLGLEKFFEILLGESDDGFSFDSARRFAAPAESAFKSDKCFFQTPPTADDGPPQ